MPKREWTPEERAVLKAGAEARQRLAAWIERTERLLEEERSRRERRRRLVNRLSRGLLARR
jgi:predicted secreted protein